MQINPELGNSNSVLSPQYYQYTALSISSNVFARTFNEGRQTNRPQFSSFHRDLRFLREDSNRATSSSTVGKKIDTDETNSG